MVYGGERFRQKHGVLLLIEWTLEYVERFLLVERGADSGQRAQHVDHGLLVFLARTHDQRQREPSLAQLGLRSLLSNISYIIPS